MLDRPVRTEADYEAVMAQIERLMEAEPGTPEADRLEVLCILAEAYEQRHHPIPPPDPIEAIKLCMEQMGLTPRDLEPHIGSRTRVWEVLGGKRPLTLPMIRRLAAALPIPAEVLIAEPAQRQAS